MIGNNSSQRSSRHIPHEAVLVVRALFQNTDRTPPFGTQLGMGSCRCNPYKWVGVEQTGLRKPCCGQPSRLCIEAVDQLRENFRQDFSSIEAVLDARSLFRHTDWTPPFGTQLDTGAGQIRKPRCRQPSRFCVETVDQLREHFRRDFSSIAATNLFLIPIQGCYGARLLNRLNNSRLLSSKTFLTRNKLFPTHIHELWIAANEGGSYLLASKAFSVRRQKRGERKLVSILFGNSS